MPYDDIEEAFDNIIDSLSDVIEELRNLKVKLNVG